jgi:type I restriction enzyme M protein
MRQAGDNFIEFLNEFLTLINEREWLVSKFGEDGQYQDVLGLCKIATIQEIAEKNYSLTPGAYVGVAEQEDDGVDFHERMNEIHAEFAKLNQEANVLMEEIQKSWEDLK